MHNHICGGCARQFQHRSGECVDLPGGWCGCLPVLPGKYEKWLRRFSTTSRLIIIPTRRRKKALPDADTQAEMNELRNR